MYCCRLECSTLFYKLWAQSHFISSIASQKWWNWAEEKEVIKKLSREWENRLKSKKNYLKLCLLSFLTENSCVWFKLGPFLFSSDLPGVNIIKLFEGLDEIPNIMMSPKTRYLEKLIPKATKCKKLLFSNRLNRYQDVTKCNEKLFSISRHLKMFLNLVF